LQENGRDWKLFVDQTLESRSDARKRRRVEEVMLNKQGMAFVFSFLPLFFLLL
jgi:hypothetical protein